MKRRLLGMLATAMAAALWFPAPDAKAEEAEVDVALVLAVDVSRSMDPTSRSSSARASWMPSVRPWCTTPSATACWGGSS